LYGTFPEENVKWSLKRQISAPGC